MAENERGDDQKGSSMVGPKSPWKTPVVADAPVMGTAESWPALSDAQQQQQQQQRSKLTDSASKPPPPPTVTVASGGDTAAPPEASPRVFVVYLFIYYVKYMSEFNVNLLISEKEIKYWKKSY
jgi:la-related protein 1